MAIGFVGNSAYNAGATSVAITKPASTVSGNLMIAFVCSQDTNGTATVTTLAGWTYINDIMHNFTTSNAATHLYAFYRVAGGSEGSSYTFTGSAGTGSLYGYDGIIRTYSGTAISGAIINYTSSATISSGTVVIPTFSGHETFLTGEWYVACCASPANEVPSTTSPSLSHIHSNTGQYQGYYDGDYAPSSVPGTETFSSGISQAVGIGLTILPPAVVSSPKYKRLDVRLRR
jgi:hypothetical protein